MNGVLWQEACWRQSGSLLQLLRLDGSERKIAMVGAGGKTTVLFGLARELQESGRRVLVTTTTRQIRLPGSSGKCCGSRDWPCLAGQREISLLVLQKQV